MKPRSLTDGLFRAVLMIVSLNVLALAQESRDLVNGNLIQFKDNGTWGAGQISGWKTKRCGGVKLQTISRMLLLP